MTRRNTLKKIKGYNESEKQITWRGPRYSYSPASPSLVHSHRQKATYLRSGREDLPFSLQVGSEDYQLPEIKSRRKENTKSKHNAPNLDSPDPSSSKKLFEMPCRIG